MKRPRRRRRATAEREAAEAEAAAIHDEVIAPLREIRENRLTPGVIAGIRAQIRQEGDQW